MLSLLEFARDFSMELVISSIFEAALNLPVLQLIACAFLFWEASDTFS